MSSNSMKENNGKEIKHDLVFDWSQVLYKGAPPPWN